MNAVLENPDKVWTYEEYLTLEEGVVFEFINGSAYWPPSPELAHQHWLGELLVKIADWVDYHRLGEALPRPVDVVSDVQNVVQPDIIFVADANAGLLERRGIMGTPDLVVEVISPGSVRRDRYDKRELYARFGVKEYWLADVANRSLEVLTLQNGAYQLSSFATGTGKISSTVLPGLELDLAQLD